jgi:hypothetical protein
MNGLFLKNKKRRLANPRRSETFEGRPLHRRPFEWIVNFSGRFARGPKNSLAYAQICLPIVFLFHPPKRAWVERCFTLETS